QERLRFHATRALGEIGPDAGDALPVLTALLHGRDQRVAYEASRALAKLGKQALPALAAALKSDDHHVRHDAVEAIGQVQGRDAILALVDGLKSPQADLRRRAALVLGGLQVTDKLVVLSLAESLEKDSSPEVRAEAAHALSRYGVHARPAAAALSGALADNDP